MEPAAILARLADDEDLPEGAILTARERWAEVAPLLVDLFERVAAGEAATKPLEPALFAGFYLLAERRERSAYRPLARLLAIDPRALDRLLGDATVEAAHRIMAAVFDDDPQPLYDVIETAGADPFVRSRMLQALALLVLEGRLERGSVARYLGDAFLTLQPQDECFVWYGWQSAIAALGLEELSGLVEQAFERGLIDPSVMSLADFRSDLEHALAHPESPWAIPGRNEFAPVEDAIAELRYWYDQAADDLLDDDHETGAGPPPAVNPFRNVGRNDPCPCGSGKKFKQCCLP